MFKKRFKFTDLFMVFILLIVISGGLWLERRGISYDREQNKDYYLSKREAKTPAEALKTLKASNLIIFDSNNFTSASAIDNFKQIFIDMKVPSTYIDLAKEKIPDFKDYESVVILTPDIEPFGEKALDLMDWVENGGNVMFAMTIQKDDVVSVIEQKIGVENAGFQYANVAKLRINEGYMLGYGQSYIIDEPFESSWKVDLKDSAQVYMTTDDQVKNPLVWSYKHGKGRVVVNNFGIYVKAVRGFYAASFSLLDEVGAYPVINSAAFTLDDFPAPVPSGNAEYITRDYQMSVSDFFSNVWWPDMMQLAEKYGIKYTGVVIENYDDDTSGNIEQQDDVSRFTYFGNMILKTGGEIGFHGYNHQPFSLSNVDYNGAFSYNTWPSSKAIQNSLDELIRFTKQNFPDNDHSVYVPPSNILSAEGREILAEEYPEIKTIAASYFGGTFEHEQEFETAEDGLVNAPRITSGFLVDDFNKLTAVSELNLHYISHHFVHPDDTLDEDRGAKAGWDRMFRALSNQMKWVYTTAPDIRNMTESQMGGAIQRYSALNLTKTVTDKELTLKLGNFVDEAYLMIRFNEEGFETSAIQGGQLKKLTGDLYLLHATRDTVTIPRQSK